jgi:hypothetical protein
MPTRIVPRMIIGAANVNERCYLRLQAPLPYVRGSEGMFNLNAVSNDD